jgi:hypothetical protein
MFQRGAYRRTGFPQDLRNGAPIIVKRFLRSSLQEEKRWLRIKVRVKGNNISARVEPEPFVSKE